ncbi:MAG: hypothetical protein ACJAY7_000484 [Pseudohongiellaceae bacterium]|jgi:hypothetical protein
MSITDLGSIGELIAAIATVATLVYLAIQIRSNTKTARGNTHHATSTAWSELTAKVAGDDYLSKVYQEGRLNPEALSKEEKFRFYLIEDAFMGQIENIWTQYTNDLFPKSNQDRFDNILRAQFATPGIVEYWSRRKSLFTTEFVDYVENVLRLGADDT